jgi:hypothetical protein
MSVPFALERQPRPPWRKVPAVVLAVGIARILAQLSPKNLRAVLTLVRNGANDATYSQALLARDAISAMSIRCRAGEGCLQRSIATALLCRTNGTWPTWRTGVRTDPFSAHAWVEANGEPVGESFPAGYYSPIITIEAPAPKSHLNQKSRGKTD